MNADLSESLRQAVSDAGNLGTPLMIVGSGSKAFYGRKAAGNFLEVAGHAGILRYEPTELVITARCGTRLSDIESALAECGQMLPFEPPYFGQDATLGGTLACGFSGPRRPFAGSARDCMLGCRILNGKGEVLSFGGEVMKNVAGFDVSRLMVGAMGTLGVILEASLKVCPKPEHELTVCFESSVEHALSAMNRWCSEPWPLSGLAYDGNRIYIRLSGSERAVDAVYRKFGGEILEDGNAFWEDLREQRHEFFRADGNLWRISLAPATPVLDVPGDWFYDWGGALRWLKTDAPAEAVFRAAEAAGGHATLFRGDSGDGRVFQPLSEGLKCLHANLKKAFDPNGLFNPGRFYENF
ncbi:glycolate oxidase subunit GlcE [Methylocaldum szegediense]|uniref:Glycolate dehydrogenase, putative FAD-binding subunit n=1 Tax=Methylocaldum szegediense TaxID=73780 RepID=A0ABN8WWZ6_9GAMM|nr:glycolate oxidase subunit GlcE [Methylocaldum szegediense]CAI8736308.1 glycolate dehydrogenase, putative FAD-binding subunit [Methylocaldum szegediense]